MSINIVSPGADAAVLKAALRSAIDMTEALATAQAATLAQVESVLPPYYTTMSILYTAAVNVDNLRLDVLACAASGRQLRLKKLKYPFGKSTTVVADISGTGGIDIEGDGAELVVPAGLSTKSVFQITTTAGWTDHDVNAFVQSITTGGGLSASEVSQATLTGGPSSMVRGEMVSIFSNDMIYYGRADGSATGDMELNFQHDIAEVFDYSANVLYFASKLPRTYTPANSGTNRICKVRRYNNKNIKLNIDGIVLDTAGDPYADTNPDTARPKFVFEIVGFQFPRLGAKCRTKRAWQGDWMIQNTQGADICYAGAEDAPNTLPGGGVALGYCLGIYGANLAPLIRVPFQERSRHTTTIWREAPVFTLGVPVIGTTTRIPLSEGTGIQNATGLAANQYVFIEGMSTATGTLGAVLNNTWQKITAVGASRAYIDIQFNSTTYTAPTAGTGTGKVFDLNDAYAYGEVDAPTYEGGIVISASGSIDDEHENSRGIIRRNRRFINGPHKSYEATGGRALNNRGAGALYEGYWIEGFEQAAQFHSFSQNHGIENTIILKDWHIRRQSNRGAASPAPMFEPIVGAQVVTDKGRLIWEGGSVFDGYYQVLKTYANSPDILIRGVQFGGDWGVAAPAQPMFRIGGGNVLIEECEFDFANVTTAAYMRLVNFTAAGKLTFKRCNIKNLFASSGNWPFTFGASGCTLELIDTDVSFRSSDSANTQRFIHPNGTAQTVNLLGLRLANASKLAAVSGLVNVGVAASVVNGLKENIRGDAAFNIVGSSIGAGSSATLTAMTAGT